MIVNHLIVGASDFEKSATFYCELFGFTQTGDDPGAQGGLVLATDCPVRAAPAQNSLKFKSTSCPKVTTPAPSAFFSTLPLAV
jgi:catechol 2,3-dioxygenase-like lactoylglutathione lyase family enzyme